MSTTPLFVVLSVAVPIVSPVSLTMLTIPSVTSRPLLSVTITWTVTLPAVLFATDASVLVSILLTIKVTSALVYS